MTVKPVRILYAEANFDDFIEAVAENLALRLSCPVSNMPTQSSSTEDILFKSIQEAADYYGVCYQTISKHLDKIPYLTFGRSIRIYKSDLENAILKHNLFSKKGGKK